MNNKANKIRAQRIRRKLKKVNTERFRLTVFKSSRNLSAQIIDDANNKTLVSASSFAKKDIEKKKNADLPILIADTLAKKALEKKITKVYFDRGKYKYHGRIKIFAEALRKGGLIF